MLAFALALFGAVPIAVQATGMEPQLRIVRQAAANRNWPITCVGHAGEEGVVRVGVPAGVSREAVDGFIEAVTSVASSVGNLGVDASKQTCDQAPVQVTSSEPVRTLTFTTGERDARLLAAAQECGYAKVHWRPIRPEDIAIFKGQLDTTKYSTTLDAGEDASARYGPMTCFVNIGLAPLFKHKR
jgi:hypothetical protein